MSSLIHRISGCIEAPLAIYLPGIHGDWTPLETARDALSSRVRLVEIEYPKEPGWDMQRYAHSVRELIDSLKADRAHIVAESFGSLVAWEFALHAPDRIRSLILVGGFTSTPGMFKTTVAKAGLSMVPTILFEKVVDIYSRSRGRKKTDGHGGGSIIPYSSVRTAQGHRATISRLAHVQAADYRSELHKMHFPVRYIGGARDRVIPVAREIDRLTAALPQMSAFESRLIPGAPHMIVASHPDETTASICDWIGDSSVED